MGSILNVGGASGCVNEGYITYSNEAKQRVVGVKEETLMEYGAVSEETAREMAIGGAQVAGTNVALSVTGIAGPSGGSLEKPVGLTYIGCYRWKGSRENINSMVEEENRFKAVNKALKLVVDLLQTL